MALVLSLPLLLVAMVQDPAGPAEDTLFGKIPLLQVDRMSPQQQEAWRDYLLPTAEEIAFASLPWRSTFADGLRDASAVGKPLLLWVMNGHPLGCT